MATSTESYDQRRKCLKRAIDTERGLPLTEVVRQIEDHEDEHMSYEYVRSVLAGYPGKRSEPVLDAIEAQLERSNVL